jgi:hypothetical protein
MNELSNLEATADSETLAGASAPSKFISSIFSSKVPEGLTVTEREWENEYRGTETAFIKAGFVKPEWLPGHPGNAKRRVAVSIVDGEMRVLPPRSQPTDYQWQNGYICITKAPKGCLIVSVNCLEEERVKREEVAFLSRKKKRIREAREEVAKGIAELPASPEAFIKRELHTIRMVANMARTSLLESFGYSGGYGFPRELVAEFDSFMTRSIQMINNAPISFDREKRQRDIASITNKVLAKYEGLIDRDIEP